MGNRRGATGFWRKNLRDKDYVKTYTYMGDIKTGLEDVEWGGMDWIDMTHDRDRWQVLVNVVMNLQVR